MPRTYVRKPGSRTYKDYTEEQLLDAVNACKAGDSYRTVAKNYNIPFRTLWNRVNKMHQKPCGGQTALSRHEEEEVVENLISCADFGMPLERLDVRLIVKSHLDACGRTVTKFTNNIPGDDWMDGFLKRHKDELTPRMCQNIKRARAELDPDSVKAYFRNLKDSLKDVPPENILNYDETNLSDEPGVKKCLFRRGVKYPERIMNYSKGNISVMFAGGADGTILPPFVIYKAEGLWDSWCNGGPPGTRYARSKSGWMDGANFQEWFLSIVVPWARRKEGVKVIIGDNLSSHLDKTVLQQCEQQNIRFVLLPPHSTDKCQPLDVAFFGPMKMEWRKIMEDFKQKKPSSTSLDKSLFPGLLGRLMDNMGMRAADNVIAGFRACGIHPLNETAVLKKFPTSTTANEDEPAPRRVSAAVLEYLQNFKYSPRTEKAPRTSRKKLQVEPGKSISSEDLQANTKQQSETRKSTSASPVPPISQNTASGSSSSDSEESVADSSEEEWQPPQKKMKSRNVFSDFF